LALQNKSVSKIISKLMGQWLEADNDEIDNHFLSALDSLQLND
jgi:hypothetical protein